MEPSVDIELEGQVRASQRAVWRSLTECMHEWFVGDERMPEFRMSMEPMVGGRMFRDLSQTHGQGAGHLWGIVQVFKPPHLLEVIGPLAVSDAAINHLTFRLVPGEDTTIVRIKHRAFGLVPAEYAKGFEEGWRSIIEEGLKDHAERNKDL